MHGSRFYLAEHSAMVGVQTDFPSDNTSIKVDLMLDVMIHVHGSNPSTIFVLIAFIRSSVENSL